MEYIMYSLGFDCHLKLGGIFLFDFNTKHKDPSVQDFITS